MHLAYIGLGALAPDEALDACLPVNGTTGYDALREIGEPPGD